MAPRDAADAERGRQRIFAGDHRNAAATVGDVAASNGSDLRVIEVELKGVRVRIGADAPSAVIAATLKALRS